MEQCDRSDSPCARLQLTLCSQSYLVTWRIWFHILTPPSLHQLSLSSRSRSCSTFLVILYYVISFVQVRHDWDDLHLFWKRYSTSLSLLKVRDFQSVACAHTTFSFLFLHRKYCRIVLLRFIVLLNVCIFKFRIYPNVFKN